MEGKSHCPLSDADKRDLDIVFGSDKIVQTKEVFHNANSAIRKSIWKKINFDNNISNIEDRIWAEKIIKRVLNNLWTRLWRLSLSWYSSRW